MDTQAYKAALATELAEITESLNELGTKDPTNPNDWVTTPDEPAKNTADPNDFGDRSEEWMERRGELTALETRANNIARALQKIMDESFGTCEICSAEIEADRLAVNPSARTCKTHIDNEAQLPV